MEHHDMKVVDQTALKAEAKTIRELIHFSGKAVDKDGAQSTLQSEGVAALWHCMQKERFAYLADEVGMGKTRQAMAIIALQYLKKPDSRVVVICPKETLQRQWLKEWNTFINDCFQIKDGTLKSVLGVGSLGMDLHDKLSLFAQSLLKDNKRLHLLRYSSFSRPIGFNQKETVAAIRSAYKRALKGIGINTLNEVESALFLQYDIDNLANRSRKLLTDKLNVLYVDRLSTLLRNESRGVDLIICDESQHLRNIHNQRNSNINRSLGQHKSQWLFLSATPLHTGKNDIKSLDQYLCWHKRDGGRCAEQHHKCDQITKELDKGVDIVALLNDFLVRRSRKYLDKDKRAYDKLAYRQYAHEAKDARNDVFASMVTAMVQKQLVRTLDGGNNKFRQSECSSFESMARSIKRTFKNKDGVLLEAAEVESINGDKPEETPDRQAIDHLNDSLRNKLIEKGLLQEEQISHVSLPHPKLQQVVKEVSDRCFRFGANEKSLIFVRRLDTVDELVFQLQKQFQRELDDRIRRWGEILSVHPSRDTNRQRLEPDTFWQLKGFTDNEEQLDLSMISEEGDDEDDIGKESTLPYFSAIKKASKEKGMGFLFSFFTRLLIAKSEKVKNPLLPLFVPLKDDQEHVTDQHWQSFIDVIFAESEAPDWVTRGDSQKIWGLKRCIIQSLRRSDFIVDLYILHEFYQGKTLSLTEKLIRFFDKKHASEWEGLQPYIENWRTRIQQWCLHFDLISSKCFQRDSEGSLLIDNEFARMGPVVGRSGRIKNKYAVSQFKMPCLPNVLVCTDVLKEGVDMHLFCDEVIHYGVAWTSGDLEQRIGRVDRVNSLYHRKIASFSKEQQQIVPRLKSSFPFLAGTLDEYQVTRVIKEKQHSDLRLDFGKSEQQVKEISLEDLMTNQKLDHEQMQSKDFYPKALSFDKGNCIDQLVNSTHYFEIQNRVNNLISKLKIFNPVFNTVSGLEALVVGLPAESFPSLFRQATFQPIKERLECIFPLSDDVELDTNRLFSDKNLSRLNDNDKLEGFVYDQNMNTLVRKLELVAPYKQKNSREQIVIAEALGDFVLFRSPIKQVNAEADNAEAIELSQDNPYFYLFTDQNIRWMGSLVYRPSLLGKTLNSFIKLFSETADKHQLLYYQQDDEVWAYHSKS